MPATPRLPDLVAALVLLLLIAIDVGYRSGGDLASGTSTTRLLVNG